MSMLTSCELWTRYLNFLSCKVMIKIYLLGVCEAKMKQHVETEAYYLFNLSFMARAKCQYVKISVNDTAKTKQFDLVQKKFQDKNPKT